VAAASRAHIILDESDSDSNPIRNPRTKTRKTRSKPTKTKATQISYYADAPGWKGLLERGKLEFRADLACTFAWPDNTAAMSKARQILRHLVDNAVTEDAGRLESGECNSFVKEHHADMLLPF
jgi:hypothetical protein